MKTKSIIALLVMLISINGFSQRFELFDKLIPAKNKFKLIGISSETMVHTYKYIGVITDNNMFERKVDGIIVGLKNNVVVTVVYNLVPEKYDDGIPQETVDLLQNTLEFPLSKLSDYYAVKIDNDNITLSRVNSVLTDRKDRIMFFKSVQHRFLKL